MEASFRKFSLLFGSAKYDVTRNNENECFARLSKVFV